MPEEAPVTRARDRGGRGAADIMKFSAFCIQQLSRNRHGLNDGYWGRSRSDTSKFETGAREEAS